jgi:nicotinate-nucleotide adenylyltransferase
VSPAKPMPEDDGPLEVALYGGSFDPPHVAHVMAITYLRTVLGMARVVVVPVYAHAFDKELAPYAHRLQMCKLAFADLRGVEVSALEQELGPPGWTLRTAQEVARRHPRWQLRLAIGADVLADVHRWHSFEELVQLAPPVVLGRRGTVRPDAPPALLPEVSSTEVRALLATRDRAESRVALGRLVPRAVLHYITEHGLYS